VERCAKVVARRISEEGAELENRAADAERKLREALVTGLDEATAKKNYEAASGQLEGLRRWQRNSESAQRRKSMETLARSEASIAVSSGKFDRYPLLLNVRNGVLDLRADLFGLKQHDKDLYQTKTCLVNWNASAEAPVWRACLRTWTAGDEAMEGFLRRLAGYSITGSVEEECFAIFCGDGQNGKSTFLNTIQSVLGPYSVAAPAGLLMETRVDKASPSQQAGIASLVGARLVIASESDDSASISEAQVKAITCRDRISAKRMYEAPFDFLPTHHVFLATNHKPIITGTDDGIWRRTHLIEWNVRIPDEQRDNRLAEKLLAEREGVLRWLVEGCLEWQRIGLSPPTRAVEAISQYRNEQDAVGAFLENQMVDSPGNRLRKSYVRESYERFCESEGFRPFSAKRFAQEMYRRGYTEAKDGTQGRQWVGLAFKTLPPQ
jgi:putative DNA primase/helicase